MAHISDMLVDALVAHLQTNLDTEYTTRGMTLSEVKAGRLQDDPERPSDNIMVHIGCPVDPTWQDAPVGDRYIRFSNSLMGWERGHMSPLGEVGGGAYWYRRLSVQISTYYTRDRKEQDPAREYANITRGLVEKYCRTLAVTALTDEFDEQGSRIWVDRSYTQERGGPPDNYIWKCWVYVTVETNNPNC